MSEFKERAEIQYTFDRAYEEIVYDLKWSGRFTRGKEWLYVVLALFTWFYVIFIVRSYVIDALQEDGAKVALTYILAFIGVLFLSLQLHNRRRLKQLKALMDAVQQLKSDTQ